MCTLRPYVCCHWRFCTPNSIGPLHRTNLYVSALKLHKKSIIKSVKTHFPAQLTYMASILYGQVFDLQLKLFVQALARLCQHNGHQNLKHLRFQVHWRCIGERFVNVTKYAGRTQKTVNGRIQTFLRGPILFGTDLCVDAAEIEQNAGFFEGNGSLARWYAGQRIVPLKVDAKRPIRRKEASFHVVQQIVVAKQKADTLRVAGRCSGGLQERK